MNDQTQTQIILCDEHIPWEKDLAPWMASKRCHLLRVDDMASVFDMVSKNLPEVFILNKKFVSQEILTDILVLYPSHKRPLFIVTGDELESTKNPMCEHVVYDKVIASIENYLFKKNQLMISKTYSEQILDKISNMQLNNMSGIHCLMPKDTLYQGHGLFVVNGPNHDKHILLTNCSAPGICSVLGNVVTYEVFSGMARKGFGFEQILKEINRKIESLLPDNVHFLVNYIVYESEKNHLKIWNGCIEPLYVFHKAEKSMLKCTGANLDLNQIESTKTSIQTMNINHAKDWILYYHDVQVYGEVFGHELSQNLDALKSASMAKGKHYASANDQGLMLSIEPSNFDVDVPLLCDDYLGSRDSINLDVKYFLNAQALQSWDPLPVMMHTLMEHPALHSHRTEIYTILTELYTNALDHGVLELDSSTKQDAQGIAKYYQEKRKRLEALSDGFVKIHIKVFSDDQKQCLRFIVEDSGSGFDCSQIASTKNEYSGRGMSILRALSSDITFKNSGSSIELVYSWNRLS